MKRKLFVLMATFALVGSACTAIVVTDEGPSNRPESTKEPTGEKAFAASSLQVFVSCNDFLDYVKSEAAKRVGPYGLGGYGAYPVLFADDAIDTTTVLGSEAARGSDGGIKGVDYSGTNVQVAGVDEPDIVKTDGTRIFVVAQGTLFWIDVAGTPEIVGQLRLDGWGQQIFLSGDRLLVMTSGGFGGGVGIREDFGVSYPGGEYASPRVVLSEIDITNPETMTAITTLTLDGTIVSSRMADGTIRVVITSGPTGFEWSYPQGSGIRAEQKAIDANKKLIEESTLENWVPWYVLKDNSTGTTSDGPLLGCNQVGYPDEFSGLSMLTILSINPDEGLTPGNGIGLLATGQTVYASTENLYVATSPWALNILEEAPSKDETFSTQIHMFDISDPATATYVASGQVEGTLLSQWSMDEYEGVLRVVVTDENPWWGWSETTDTSVVTLRRRGDNLVKIGSVSGLGENERVFAVRFIADKGYVVTFRQTDPLYVVDLSNPISPKVTGELKINGYSSYLHPIGDGLLLGVGQHATDEGRTLGTQVSVFDVSDPSDPRRLSRLTFDDAYSEAEWNHLAFLWWAPEEIAVLPLQRWSWDERTGKADGFSGAVVVRVSPTQVKQVGEIRHPSASGVDCEGCEQWFAPVTRSLVIGNTLFTFSDTGALASDLDTLDDITWMPFG